jgi:hypothetical protein
MQVGINVPTNVWNFYWRSVMETNEKEKYGKTCTATDRETWIRGIKDSALKTMLDESARRNPTDAPSNNREAVTDRPATIFMRPPRNEDEFPDPPEGEDPPEDPCAGQTWVWQPDVAVQLNTGEDTCPSSEDLRRIERAVTANAERFKFPDPEVRVRCRDAKIYISIWGTRVDRGSCNDLARQRAQIPDLTGGGNFGIFLNSSLIRRLAAAAFNGPSTPKRLSGNGAPSLDGPIHLTSLSVGFKSPNIIETYIYGYDDRPWPDADFKKTITDAMFALRRIETTDSLEVNAAPAVLALISLALFTLAFPQLLPLTAFVLFTDMDALLNQSDDQGGGDGGVGARMLQTLPEEIDLPESRSILPPTAFSARRIVAPAIGGNVGIHPKKQKLVLNYGGPTVDDRGMFVSAFATRQERVPEVNLFGPATLFMYSNGQEVYGNYQAIADDFFGNKTYQWSGGGLMTIQTPNLPYTRISFKRGDVQPGESFEASVSVRVTDQEGSTASASRTITIFVNERDEGIPPICQIKPWLPECNPGI